MVLFSLLIPVEAVLKDKVSESGLWRPGLLYLMLDLGLVGLLDFLMTSETVISPIIAVYFKLSSGIGPAQEVALSRLAIFGK